MRRADNIADRAAAQEQKFLERPDGTLQKVEQSVSPGGKDAGMVDVNMKNFIAGPWRRIVPYNIYYRELLSGSSIPMRLDEIEGWSSFYGHFRFIGSLEEAKQFIDSQLIKCGYKLLTEEEYEKYLILK